MCPSTTIGVYPLGVAANENDEVSSTYEGRHLTFLASDISSHDAAHALQQKGHPCVIGEHIVGVAFKTEVLGADLIPIDTEGIWMLMVYAKDDEGNVAVVAGDELFINKSTAEISKMRNPVTHTRFGYALGGVPSGATPYVIAVKVHWQSQDEEEVVGTRAAPSIGLTASHTFRKYCYEGRGGTEQVGDWLELAITTASCFWAAAMFRRLSWAATSNFVTGYAAVAEFELAISVGDAGMDTTTIIQMNSMAAFTASHNSFLFSWMRMQDYGTLAGNQINNLFQIIDDLGTYPAVADKNTLFIVAAGGAMAPTHLMKFIVNDVEYWFHVSDDIT